MGKERVGNGREGRKGRQGRGGKGRNGWEGGKRVSARKGTEGGESVWKCDGGLDLCPGAPRS